MKKSPLGTSVSPYVLDRHLSVGNCVSRSLFLRAAISCLAASATKHRLIVTLAGLMWGLQSLMASDASLFFHYYPNCIEGADGDLGVCTPRVHVGTPPPGYTYYAFEAYLNDTYMGQINWQVDSNGVVWNEGGTAQDSTVVGVPPSVSSGIWTFLTPQSSDPNEIPNMLAEPLTVFYGTDCDGPAGAVIPMSVDVYTGGATPIPTPTPGANDTDKDKKEGGDQCDEKPPMAQYSVHSMLVSLNIEDR